MNRLDRQKPTWETASKRWGFRRLTLRRADGQVYLDRWGFQIDRLFGVYLHRMEAPDPGVDLHDHPWDFVSLVLRGGYTELRADTREAPLFARLAERWPSGVDRPAGEVVERPRWSIKRLRFDECHTIIALHRTPTWTLVLRGPRRRRWGFYLADGWMPEAQYDATVRRDLTMERQA